MARIIALDIGLKRTGIAVTDPLQMIATGLQTVETAVLGDFLEEYFRKEQVEKIIVGEPRQMDYSHSESMQVVQEVSEKLRKRFPSIPIEFLDERFTSKLALQSMKMAGASKKQMKDKSLVDVVAATIILQAWLGK